MNTVGAVGRAGSAPKIAISKPGDSTSARVYELNPLLDSRWEAFLNKHPRASVFHSTKWLKALQSAYGYEPQVVTTCAPDEVLTDGLVFCRVKSWLTGWRLVSLPFADHCEPLLSNLAELDWLLLHMKPHVDSGRWKYIEIRPRTGQSAARVGFERNQSFSLHGLDLRKSAPELFRSFHKDCIQRKIRRAEREQLQYEEGASETLLQTFYEQLVATRRRQFLPAQPLSWFRSLIAEFGPDLKIRVATKDNQPVASILTLAYKKTIVYKYGCSDKNLHRLGGMPFLFWKAILQAKEEGFEEFEMGRSDNHNEGLVAFKDRWGTVRTELNYWSYPPQPSPVSERQMAILRWVVPHTPVFALKMAGRLFYGHIG